VWLGGERRGGWRRRAWGSLRRRGAAPKADWPRPAAGARARRMAAASAAPSPAARSDAPATPLLKMGCGGVALR